MIGKAVCRRCLKATIGARLWEVALSVHVLRNSGLYCLSLRLATARSLLILKHLLSIESSDTFEAVKHPLSTSCQGRSVFFVPAGTRVEFRPRSRFALAHIGSLTAGQRSGSTDAPSRTTISRERVLSYISRPMSSFALISVIR